MTALGASVDALEARLEVVFTDRDLAARSLAHRSWCSEHGDVPSNERLEFLGDSVLSIVVTRFVYDNYPHLPEGELSEVRASVVNARSLAEVANTISLGELLLLGRGEKSGGGSNKPSILADALEAVFAAIYLDLGFAVVQTVILRLIEPRIRASAMGSGARDHKTRLQEQSAALALGRPRYLVTDSGPDHAKVFVATVFLDDVARGEGNGRSKKEAEQAAAQHALIELSGGNPDDANPVRNEETLTKHPNQPTAPSDVLG